MARGRIGAERAAFSSARRRAASVPVDLSGPAPSLSTFTRARDISSAARDDSDALLMSSKRADQRLLDNITNTLPPRRAAPSSYRSASWRAGSEPPPLFSTSYLGAHRPVPGMGHHASLAVRQARQSLGRIERELGKGSSGGYDVFNDPYYGAIETPMASPVYVPTRVTRAGSSRSVSVPPPARRYSVSGAPSSSYHAPAYSQGSRIAAIEARLLHSDYDDAPSSFHDLRYKATEARNKLDQHKVMMDRYLPIPSGPLNDVEYEVDYKYNELVPRMPCLDPYKPNPDRYTTTSVDPYRPANKPARVSEYGRPPPGPSFRPTMSDTRKRCRDVLCKTKGDPRYYDY